MFADESLGSHQLNSFAAFLEENLPVSSESSRVQIPQQKPQLKKMEDDRKQKGGKKLEQNTAVDIPDDILTYTLTTAHLMKKYMAKNPCRSAK